MSLIEMVKLQVAAILRQEVELNAEEVCKLVDMPYTGRPAKCFITKAKDIYALQRADEFIAVMQAQQSKDK